MPASEGAMAPMVSAVSATSSRQLVVFVFLVVVGFPAVVELLELSLGGRREPVEGPATIDRRRICEQPQSMHQPVGYCSVHDVGAGQRLVDQHIRDPQSERLELLAVRRFGSHDAVPCD